MTINQLIDSGKFDVLNLGIDLDRKISKPFCCDLLSVAMGKASNNCVWITVMGNINTLAIASLADVACIVLAEGSFLDEIATEKAKKEGITVLFTNEPIFESALLISEMLND